MLRSMPQLIQMSCEAAISVIEEKGYKPLSDNKLGEELKRLGINKTRIRSEGGRIFICEGIRLLSGSVHSVHSMSTV